MQKCDQLLNKYAMSLGEAVSSGPFFKAYLVNLLPGQFVQPFIDAAFSDLGLDPNVLLPSQRTDPQTGQPGTPPLPVPYPRTGQGGEPQSARCPTRSPVTRAIPRYPYREPLPGAAARRSAARAAAPAPARAGIRPRARPRRRYYVPAPGDAASGHARAGRTATGEADSDTRAIGAGDRPGTVLVAGVLVAVRSVAERAARPASSAYFDNSNGLFPGDEVRILGVPVGQDRQDRTATPAGRRSRSGSTASTKCPPTPRPRSCRRSWSPRGPSSSPRPTPVGR